MHFKIGTRYLKAAEEMKAKAFCLKVSCDAMIDLSDKDEEIVDGAEEFFECVFEKLTKVTSVSPVSKLLAAGKFVSSPKDVQSQKDAMMESLVDMIKDARKAMDIPSEMVFAKLYKKGMCDGEGKSKEK